MIYGQTATVEEGITIGAAAEPADLAVKAAYASAGIIIDKNKTLGGAYDGVVYGFALNGNAKLAKTFYTDRLCDTLGNEINVVASPYGRNAFGTGTKIQVLEGGNVVKTYAVVIFGDITGEGQIAVGDITRCIAEQEKNGTLDLVQIMACNVVLAGRTDAIKKTGLYTTALNDVTKIISVIDNSEEIQVEMATAHYNYSADNYA
jgi:hypothetical protein